MTEPNTTPLTIRETARQYLDDPVLWQANAAGNTVAGKLLILSKRILGMDDQFEPLLRKVDATVWEIHHYGGCPMAEEFPNRGECSHCKALVVEVDHIGEYGVAE